MGFLESLSVAVYGMCSVLAMVATPVSFFALVAFWVWLHGALSGLAKHGKVGTGWLTFWCWTLGVTSVVFLLAFTVWFWSNFGDTRNGPFLKREYFEWNKAKPVQVENN